MTIKFRSDFDVSLVQHMGDDEMICKAARVSTLGAASIESEESIGLISFLMNNRHGSPFEHASLTFRISQPIAMWREFMRHRVGVSYNEESGRYKELEPKFYIPPRYRGIVQVGKAGSYEMVDGDWAQRNNMVEDLAKSYRQAWDSYQSQLKAGIAKEVARFCLPVATYSTAYVTMNPRSLMHFLSLRTKHPDSTFPSFPQWEIDQVACMMESIFEELFPITHNAFNSAGRVCP